jgi:D-tyrosyl-tRNA(Tyr) deacylase
MRAVVQRVTKGAVTVNGEVVGAIDQGLVVFLGVGQDDSREDVDYLTSKIPFLRIFQDKEGKLNRSVTEIKGGILVVSQFTLFGDCRHGRRPSFTAAAEAAMAQELYHYFVLALKEKDIPVATGIFQANMQVEIINDGPVTLLLDSKKLF